MIRMNSINSNREHWPSVGSGIWTRWWGYLVRWLTFGVVVSVYQRVEDYDNFWHLLAIQIGIGLMFGLACAVVFTIAENKLNTPRVTWKTWLIVFATWVVVKTVFVTAIALS